MWLLLKVCHSDAMDKTGGLEPAGSVAGHSCHTVILGKRLAGRTSRKRPMLCGVGRKTSVGQQLEKSKISCSVFIQHDMDYCVEDERYVVADVVAVMRPVTTITLATCCSIFCALCRTTSAGKLVTRTLATITVSTCCFVLSVGRRQLVSW